MTTRASYFPYVICIVLTLGVAARAQTPERQPTNAAPQAQEQSPGVNQSDPVATEIGLLRKSLQALNTRLREIGEQLRAPAAKQGDTATDKQNRIALNLDLLTRAEQRAELLRKQLIELTEKETSFRTRLAQLDEDMRPDNIDRSVALVGSIRGSDLRDTRRRVLENERKGLDSLLTQTSQSRVRLEDDVKQADGLVAKLRQRLLPLIDKEIEKLNPN
ncbi:MAG TPA: hypothetical protein VF546_16000 [Pyrinomonadaceae bacterium]|jgi:hypothetical protein